MNTWSEMGKQFGVSRERVRQIAVEEGITNTRRVPNAAYLRRVCVKCGAQMHVEGSVCLKCRKIEIPCTNCGKPVTRSAKHQAWLVNSKGTNYGLYTGRAFCNRVCLGQWTARSFGFSAHPENTKKNHPFPYRAEYEQLRDTGEVIVPGSVRRASNWAFHLFGRDNCACRTLEDGRVRITLKR